MKMIDKCRSAIRPLGLAVALCFSVAPAANATTLSNFLTFDGPAHLTPFANQGGGEDKLQDDSLTGFINVAGSPFTLDVGDIVFGYITLSDLQASGKPNVSVGPNSQIAIMFAATITGAGTGGSLALGAAPGTLGLICGALCAPAGILPTTVGVVLSTTQSNANPANDPLNWDALPLSPQNFTANYNGANGNGPWSWEATLGLSGDSFFEFSGSLLGGGFERGAFDITSTAFNDASKDFLPVDVYDFGGGYHTNKATLNTGTITVAADAEMARGWTFTDQGTFYVNPIPEPGALALMGIALAGIAGFTRRRRKQ